MAENHTEIGERHLELLRVLGDLVSGDPAGVAHMDRAAQLMGLNSVGKEADRREYEALARGLEEAGYVRPAGSEYSAGYGQLTVTEEGRRRLGTS